MMQRKKYVQYGSLSLNEYPPDVARQTHEHSQQ